MAEDMVSALGTMTRWARLWEDDVVNFYRLTNSFELGALLLGPIWLDAESVGYLCG